MNLKKKWRGLRRKGETRKQVGDTGGKNNVQYCIKTIKEDGTQGKDVKIFIA